MSERRHEWFPVARWEFLRIVKRPDFIIGVLLTPALIFIVSVVVSHLGRDRTRDVAIVRMDAEGTIHAAGEAALPPLRNYRWIDPGTADTTALLEGVRAKRFAAAYLLPADFATQAPAVIQVTRRTASPWTAEVRAFVQSEARHERLLALGLSPERITGVDEPLTVRRMSALGRPAGSGRADFLVPFGMLLLMVTVILSGVSYLMVGISGEKNARVTEVVVSAVPAEAWMDGKLVAFTGVGLVTGVLWAGALVLMSGTLSLALPLSVNPANLAIGAVFAVLGLYLYNALLAALMASAQSLQSASKWQSNFMILPFIPVFFLRSLLENPDSTAMTILSHVPFFSPVMIPVRLIQGGVRWWEVGVAVLVLIGACIVLRRLAGRVFRIGMLMYGKDMTLAELVRWARVK